MRSYAASGSGRGQEAASSPNNCRVTASGGKKQNLAPASTAMLATLMRPARSTPATASPANSRARYWANSAPYRPSRCRIRSFQLAGGRSLPYSSHRTVGGTWNHRVPVAST